MLVMQSKAVEVVVESEAVVLAMELKVVVVESAVVEIVQWVEM